MNRYIVFLCILILHINLSACQPFEIRTYDKPIPTDIECYLGADIGGTNSDFGVFEFIDNIPTLLFSLHTKTETIKNFSEVVHNILAYAHDTYNVTIKHACFAAPGVATKNKDYSSVHGLFDITSTELIERNNLETALVVNDVFVIGHGLKLINQKDIMQIYGEDQQEYGPCAIISAGTGLGSSIMAWDTQTQQYVTHPGEAGILEFSPNNQFEYDLANHIKEMYNSKVTYWSYFVSGNGIKRIYSMLKLTGKYRDSLHLDTHAPAVIFAHPEDELCKATMELYFKLFARFARNYIFPVLPYGGLYITGGVAAKNAELFPTLFVPEYENCVHTLQNILKRIPVYVVTDYNVSLYGAVQYLLLEKNLA